VTHTTEYEMIEEDKCKLRVNSITRCTV